MSDDPRLTVLLLITLEGEEEMRQLAKMTSLDKEVNRVSGVWEDREREELVV